MNARTLSALAATVVLGGVLTGCGSHSSAATHDVGGTSGGGAGVGTGATTTPCGLATPAELSAAVGGGVTYTKEAGGNTYCDVTGTQPEDAFLILLRQGDSDAEWKATVAATDSDDGGHTTVEGIGDDAIAGNTKEFDFRAGGYIVIVQNADFSTTTASQMTRSRAIAKLLASKLG